MSLSNKKNEIQYFTKAQMQLKTIMLSKMSQSQKHKYVFSAM